MSRPSALDPRLFHGRPGRGSQESKASGCSEVIIELAETDLSGSDERGPQRRSTLADIDSMSLALVGSARWQQRETSSLNNDSSKTPPWHRSLRFLFKTVILLANLATQIMVLRVYLRHREEHRSFYVQLLNQILEALLSSIVACQDADVRRWVIALPPLWRVIALPGIMGLFGVCQLIHVKRAWARQIRVQGVISQLDDKDFLWTGPALGAEPALPIPFLTGTFSALIGCYAFIMLNHEGTDSYIIVAACVSSMVVVSWSVVEVDNAVSMYVAKRYHLDPCRAGTRVGHLQCMFPLCHTLYRMTEVLARVTSLSLLIVYMAEEAQRDGKTVAWILLAGDYVLGVAVLKKYSPQAEQLSVHILVGLALLLANVVRFTDVSGFCRPAQNISQVLEAVRVSGLVVMAGVFFFEILLDEDDNWKGDEDGKIWRRWVLGTKVLLVAATVYYGLRVTIFRRNGDDLHSAVAAGKHRRVKKLLDAGSGGEALDVNGAMKDTAQTTPAMIAAQMGDIEGLRLLFEAGARVAQRDHNGETCLHHAVRLGQTEAVAFLLQQKGAREVVREDAKLLDLADRAYYFNDASRRELRELLEAAGAGGRMARFASDKGIEYGQMRVKPVAVCGNHLNKLFPDAVQEEVPPIAELISVSGLVLAHAIGPLARCIFHRQREIKERDVNSVPVDSLHRVRVLGQGAFGQVIEVEEQVEWPPSALNEATSGLSFGRMLSTGFFASFPNTPTHGNLNALPTSRSSNLGPLALGGPGRRFAMKLQPKTQEDTGWQVCSEALALQRVAHPFIVRLEQAFQTPQFFALVLELCSGGDLNKLLLHTVDHRGRCSGLPPARAARYAGQVLLALIYLHEVPHIVYRDMKPENVLLSSKDEAKLADFGLASYVGKRRRKRMTLVGTRGFLAPELITGVEDSSSDEGERVDSCNTDREQACEEIDPFLTDAYSYGMSLEIMLLGEDTAVRLSDQEGGAWLLPRGGSEAENTEALLEARDNGRLSPEGCELLVALLHHRPKRRSHLVSPAVRNHGFFLQALACNNLEEHLLPAAPASP